MRPAVLALALAAVSAQPDAPADLIVHNATIYTVDTSRPLARALAVRGDRIVLVGEDADALALRGPATRVIDAGGRAIVPGFHDAHAHFQGLGAALQQIDLRGTRSLDEVLARVQARAAAARPGEWILGRSWDQNDWPDKVWPTAGDLDRVAPDHPVYLTRVDGHAALVNSRALAAAGVTRDTPDPPGGRFIRAADGTPTGVLIDRAMQVVARLIPPPSGAQLEEQILLADAECRRLGITTVHDAGVPGTLVDLYRKLVDDGRLQTRLYVMLRMPLAQLRPFFEKGPIVGYGGGRLDVRAIKIGADGALGSRGAALLEPYSDEPATSGLMTTPGEDIYAMTLAAARAGFQTCIHAIGDRANRVTMDVFERVLREVPSARDLRQRNEHAQVLDAAEIPRFAKLGVIASIQPTHCTSDMPWAPDRLGPERVAEGAYVWQKLRKAGAILASGSDFPVEEPNPMLGFHAAVTRQAPDGLPPGGWAPEERLTREQALRSFTLDAAFAAHSETRTGSLEPGKLADFVMLSRDIMQVPPREILDTRVLLTVTGGRITYEGTPARP
ncbi:MAG TPA: amidohydrolase [Vicinamibacterales bacterium]